VRRLSREVFRGRFVVPGTRTRYVYRCDKALDVPMDNGDNVYIDGSTEGNAFVAKYSTHR
jgi:hypothetical protein